MTDPRGIPTPDAIRCSYEDAPGAGQTRLSGTVFGEDPGAFPGIPLEGVRLTFHPLDQLGGLEEEVGHVTSDPQGHFHVAILLKPGDYAAVARNEDGAELGRARFFTDHKVHHVEELQVLLPMDPALKEAAEGALRPTGSGESPTSGEGIPPSGPAQPAAEGLELSPREAD